MGRKPRVRRGPREQRGQWISARATPEAAPHFNLQASTDQRIALTDYVGKQEVVLLFYMGAG